MTGTFIRSRTALAWVVLSAAVPSAASAQAASEAWPGLSPSGLQTVYLLDSSGTEFSGKLLKLDPQSVVLLMEGAERRFDIADVSRIQKRDSLKNGTLIGVAVGFVMGLVAAGISDCPGDDPGGDCAGLRAVTLAVSTGVYAGLGAGIDALVHGRTTIYTAPGSSARAAPAAPRAALQVGFSW